MDINAIQSHLVILAVGGKCPGKKDHFRWVQILVCVRRKQESSDTLKTNEISSVISFHESELMHLME